MNLPEILHKYIHCQVNSKLYMEARFGIWLDFEKKGLCFLETYLLIIYLVSIYQITEIRGMYYRNLHSIF